MVKLTMPYWLDSEAGGKARWRLATVVALTLGTTGVSVTFNFLGRDFFNAISEKDAERFAQMLVKWLCALCAGIPVFVFRDYFQSMLALEWREWMTKKVTSEYLANRAFYQVQAGALVDNPDQRIASDVRQFTETALGFSMTVLNAVIDLVSFSEILYSIYPPLFAALLVYSIGGTGATLFLGRKLVGLNFQQEAQEANFRYGLVRVRENAESIAFYSGEAAEGRLLFERLGAVVENYVKLIRTSRNLEFFTSFYRFLIQILPAAVVAPLYFRNQIGFGVINQSSSAFNHILTDVSLVVYQFESLAGFSAVIDRLGEFSEVVGSYTPAEPAEASSSFRADSGAAAGAWAEPSSIGLVDVPLDEVPRGLGAPLLELVGVSLRTPGGGRALVDGLDLRVPVGESLLVVGPSGAGKTSLLRAIAGLWSTGSGTIRRFGRPVAAGAGGGDIFFVPQRPYMVLGSLRDQLLYPTWSSPVDAPGDQAKVSSGNGAAAISADAGWGLDAVADWASMLSLGEQQRLAFARVLLARPRLVLMDESTSALDVANEARLYAALREAGITFVSVGHRPTLTAFHDAVLRLEPADEEGVEKARGQNWRVLRPEEAERAEAQAAAAV
ncbi:hypothetical protein WJX81_000349 [Elliptochloris bilobata]|uniref:ATP-dependent transporter ycf16 n=1 Tax=Elliptochloris bilobata TaxID=381761 RepID=A0AAW1RAL3_9CHLO